jgi:hypothetical protein
MVHIVYDENIKLERHSAMVVAPNAGGVIKAYAKQLAIGAARKTRL